MLVEVGYGARRAVSCLVERARHEDEGVRGGADTLLGYEDARNAGPNLEPSRPRHGHDWYSYHADMNV